MFRSVDHAAVAYLMLREALGGIRAIVPGEVTMRPRAGECRCGSRLHRWTTSRTKGRRLICAGDHCGRAWPMERVVDSGGSGGRRLTRAPMERERDLAADLADAFQTVPSDAHSAFWAYQRLYRRPLPGGARRVDLVAEHLGITTYEVKRRLRDAREAAESRLQRKGMLYY